MISLCVKVDFIKASNLYLFSYREQILDNFKSSIDQELSSLEQDVESWNQIQKKSEVDSFIYYSITCMGQEPSVYI